MNTQLIYENPLAREEDIKDWILEGSFRWIPARRGC